MKTLILLRHAKSSWDDADLRDFDRPLNKRGRKAAPLIGNWMRKRNIKPDLVLCSSAVRTRETLALVVQSAGIDVAPRYDERIYDASVGQLLEIVTEIEESAETVLIVGHNPGMEGLLKYLTGADEHMPTAALAQIALDIKGWSDVQPECGSLEMFVKPKELSKD